MTTIAKLFADARQGVQNISGRTDHFIDLDIGGESYRGTLEITSKVRGRPLSCWSCMIVARHHERDITFVYGAPGKTANEALSNVERKVQEHARMMGAWVMP